MKVIVNGESLELAENATVAILASLQNLPEKGIAVAVNNDMVPRVDWAAHVLKEGDDIIIIRAVCGG